jgi:hypothetical protein
MGLSTTPEATTSVATRQFRSLLWNSEVHYRIHKRSPLVSFLSQTNAVHTISSYLSQNHLNIIHQPPFWSCKWAVSIWLFHQQPKRVPVLPISATCPIHLIPLDLIILLTLGEEYESWSSSLCSFLRPSVSPSLLGPNILLSTLFSNTLSLCSSLNVRDRVSHPYRATHKQIQFYNLHFGPYE